MKHSIALRHRARGAGFENTMHIGFCDSAVADADRRLIMLRADPAAGDIDDDAFDLNAGHSLRRIDRTPDRTFRGLKIDDDAALQPRRTLMADAEDPETRTMRVEIDLPNPDNRLREGMYGSATIYLNQGKKVLTVPSSCLVGDVVQGKGKVFVVESGVAHTREVSVSTDNGVSTEIVKGLSETDEVVARHSGALADGTAVDMVPAASAR